jgi:Gluconate 2-dehydrogenase subunit 3
MRRREFVRAIVSVIVAPRLLFSQQTAKPALPPPAPVPWTLGLNPRTPLPHTEMADENAEMERRFFTALQMATLIRLCDVLLPPVGGKPGALQAGTPLFLDFLIGGSPAARQSVYTGGLNWLDSEAQKRYRKPFAKLENAEADQLLRPWLRTWMSDHPPTEPHANFVNIAHDDIRTATANSKVWSETTSSGAHELAGTDLYWYPIEPDMHAVSSNCTLKSAHVTAAPKATHTLPQYSR